MLFSICYRVFSNTKGKVVKEQVIQIVTNTSSYFISVLLAFLALLNSKYVFQKTLFFLFVSLPTPILQSFSDIADFGAF